jgi:RND family efflux transporter MFP subunit
MPMLRLLPAVVLICCAHDAAAQTVESFTEPFRKVDIVSAEPGILRTLLVREGDTVEENQRLGALDCDVQEIALAIAQQNLTARGQYESALAERDLRQRRLARLRELRAAEHATQDEVDRAVADLRVAEANVQSALEKQRTDELEVRRIEALIERRVLKSPIDGVITRVYKDEADHVGATMSPVMTLMQLDPLRITFSIPNASGTALRPGQSVALMLPESDQNAVGTVEFVSPVSEAESGTVRVKVLLKNPQGKFRCGVRCVIDLDATPRT